MKNAFSSAVLAGLFTPVKLETPGGLEDLPTVESAFGGRVISAHYSGLLSQARLDHFKPLLFGILTGNVQQIIIDLEETRGVSQSTLGVLVDFAAAVLGRGKKMYLFSPPADLSGILDGRGLGIFFEILHTEEDVINILPDE
jgi:anti-anti-sigma regulatory factor